METSTPSLRGISAAIRTSAFPHAWLLPMLLCLAAGGAGAQSLPVLKTTLPGSWESGWTGSPAVYDLDGDGTQEIIAGRHGVLYVWNGATDSLVWRAAAGKDGVNGPAEGTARIYAAPVVGDFDGQGKGEIAIAWAGNVAVYDHQGKVMAGWPKAFPGPGGDARSLAAADLDGDGRMEILAVRAGADPSTVAFTLSGAPVPGWPRSGECEGCVDKGGITQTLGIADLDGDGKPEVVVPYDTSHVGILNADGSPRAAAPEYSAAGPWASSVPFYHDDSLARAGLFAPGEPLDGFAHSPPAFADLDGDGKREIILYSTRKRAGDTAILGNCLWVVRHDMTRAKGFEKPLCSEAPIFTRNWNDIVETVPSPAIADLDGDGRPEIIVPSSDGFIYAFASDGSQLWNFKYDSPGEPWIMATEVVVGDLGGDGKPEVVFNMYSVDHFVSTLTILDARGRLQRKGLLDKRGSMAAPTLADADGDGKIDIIVSLKDVVGDGKNGVQVWTLESAGNAAPPWPTGRGGYLRAGRPEGTAAPTPIRLAPPGPGTEGGDSMRSRAAGPGAGLFRIQAGPWFDLLGKRTGLRR